MMRLSGALSLQDDALANFAQDEMVVVAEENGTAEVHILCLERCAAGLLDGGGRLQIANAGADKGGVEEHP